MKTTILTWTTLLLASAAPRLGLAQTIPADEPPITDTQTTPAPMEMEPAPMQPLPQYQASSKPNFVKTPAGMYVLGGGGATGFVDGDVDDVTKVGGAYDLRLVYGSRTPIAVEAAYVGSANSVSALGLANNAFLFGNGVEGNARLNILPRAILQPYVTVGAAWRHYSLRSDVNTSNVRDSDDVFEVPVSAGLAWRYAGFIADVRGSYRQSFENDLIGDNNLSTWGAGAHVGFEF